MSFLHNTNLRKTYGWFSMLETDLQLLMEADVMKDRERAFPIYGHINGLCEATTYMDTFLIASADAIAHKMLRELYGTYGTFGDERVPVFHMLKFLMHVKPEDLEDTYESSGWSVSASSYREMVVERRRIVMDATAQLAGMAYLKLYPESIILNLPTPEKDVMVVNSLATRIPMDEEVAERVLQAFRGSETTARFMAKRLPLYYCGKSDDDGPF